jgi:hypothetical protein
MAIAFSQHVGAAHRRLFPAADVHAGDDDALARIHRFSRALVIHDLSVDQG